MVHGNAEKNGFTRQNAVWVLDGLFHEFLDDKRICGVIGDGFFQVAAFEVDFLYFLAFKDEALLIVEANGAFANPFVLELRLYFEDSKVAEVRGAWLMASS